MKGCELQMAAEKKNRSKTFSVSSQNTVAESTFALRNVIKQEHNLDVDVKVRIHGWPTTLHLAKLAMKDMVAGTEGWERNCREVPGYLDNGKNKGILNVIDAKGTGVNKGLELIIFKSEGEKIHRPRAIPKNFAKYSKVAYAIMSIRSIIRELYGVDAFIEVQAKVKISQYQLIPSVNPNVTIETAREILSSVAIGTKWMKHELTRQHTSSWGTYDLGISGNNVNFSISIDLPNNSQD